MSILTISCDCEESVIHVVDTARALIECIRRMFALERCHVFLPVKLFSSSQMTFGSVSFSSFWTRPHHSELFFRCFENSVFFCQVGPSLVICEFQSRCIRPSLQRLACRDVAVWNEIDVSASKINLHLICMYQAKIDFLEFQIRHIYTHAANHILETILFFLCRVNKIK